MQKECQRKDRPKIYFTGHQGGNDTYIKIAMEEKDLKDGDWQDRRLWKKEKQEEVFRILQNCQKRIFFGIYIKKQAVVDQCLLELFSLI